MIPIWNTMKWNEINKLNWSSIRRMNDSPTPFSSYNNHPIHHIYHWRRFNPAHIHTWTSPQSNALLEIHLTKSYRSHNAKLYTRWRLLRTKHTRKKHPSKMNVCSGELASTCVLSCTIMSSHKAGLRSTVDTVHRITRAYDKSDVMKLYCCCCWW